MLAETLPHKAAGAPEYSSRGRRWTHAVVVKEVRSLKHTYVGSEGKTVIRRAVLIQTEVRTRRTSAPWESCRCRAPHIGEWGCSSWSQWSERSYKYLARYQCSVSPGAMPSNVVWPPAVRAITCWKQSASEASSRCTEY